jgi:hypothetical protein
MAAPDFILAAPKKILVPPYFQEMRICWVSDRFSERSCPALDKFQYGLDKDH